MHDLLFEDEDGVRCLKAYCGRAAGYVTKAIPVRASLARLLPGSTSTTTGAWKSLQGVLRRARGISSEAKWTAFVSRCTGILWQLAWDDMVLDPEDPLRQDE